MIDLHTESTPQRLMFLECRTVSRKTPGDGKLEISRATLDAIVSRRDRISTEWQGRAGTATLVEMTCSCAKGAGGQHQHLFLQSDLFRALEPGSDVELRLDEATDRVSVTPAR